MLKSSKSFGKQITYINIFEIQESLVLLLVFLYEVKHSRLSDTKC